VASATSAFPENRHFFADIKDLARAPAAPRMHTHVRSAQHVEVELSAPDDGYVYFAHLVSRHPSTRFSDNYIDLVPGATRTISVTDQEHELEPDCLRLGWA
jgi:beta-mannosidase